MVVANLNAATVVVTAAGPIAARFQVKSNFLYIRIEIPVFAGDFRNFMI